MPEPSEPVETPSLDVVRAELDIERAAQDKRNDTIDTRSGSVLGFSGVLAGLALNSKSVWALPGATVAACAAVFAASVFWPRVHSTVNPRALHGRYLVRPPAQTKRGVLDTRIEHYETSQAEIRVKFGRFKVSVVLLAVAVVLVVAALAVATIRSTLSPPRPPAPSGSLGSARAVSLTN